MRGIVQNFSRVRTDFRTRHLAKEIRKEVLDMSCLFGWLVSVEPLLDSGVHRVNCTPIVTNPPYQVPSADAHTKPDIGMI